MSPTTEISCSFLLPSANMHRSSMPRDPLSNSMITYALSMMSGTYKHSLIGIYEYLFEVSIKGATSLLHNLKTRQKVPFNLRLQASLNSDIKSHFTMSCKFL